MRYSLQLIAARLRAGGRDAYVLGDGRLPIRKIRFAPGAGCRAKPGVLYVCTQDSPALPGDMLQEDGGSCACAFGSRPPGKAKVPCLVVEGAADRIELQGMIAEAVEELDEAMARISDFAWQDNGLSAIVDSLSQLIGNPVYVVDSSFKVMAITQDVDMEEMSVNWMHAARHGYVSYDVVAGLIRSNELHDIESATAATLVESEYFYTPFANCNLRREGRVQGHLFAVQMYHAISASDLELIDLVAPVVIRALLANPAFQRSRGALYEHFVIDWLEGGLSDKAYIRRQLDALSFDANDFALAAIIELEADGDFRREHLARLLEDRQGCRAVSRDGHVVALFQLKRREERESVLRKLRSICRSERCRAFVSEAQDTFMDAPRAYRQACESARIAHAMGMNDAVVRYADVAAYQPYLNFASEQELDTFYHPAVTALRDYDLAHAVKLLPTLSAFLKNDRDVQVTADELFVHRNTLAYRLRKILELCPVDLDDFTTRHRLLESILIIENHDAIAAYLQSRAHAEDSR